MKTYLFLILTLAALTLCYYFFVSKEKPSYGTVIVLNGPSSSGKSSIQREFQKLMLPKLWLKLGIDTLFDNPMPEITPENMSYWQSPNTIRWVEQSHDTQGNNIITLLMGKEGEKVAYAMNSAIAVYAQNGCNIIVDYIAYKPEWFEDLQKKLKKFNTYYVALEISLETLEKREENRGTSPKGHARSHYSTVYGNTEYILKVSSENKSAREIAQVLKELVEST